MIPLGWSKVHLGDLIQEHREKSKVQDQHLVMTSSRSGLVLQSDYYSGGRIGARDNVGFHVAPVGAITYRSRSDDGQFFFNQNTYEFPGLVSHFYPVFRFRESDEKFFLDFLNHHRSLIGAQAVGSSQKVLSLNALKGMQFILPPAVERAKIGKILQVWDRAIETVEALVANACARRTTVLGDLLDNPAWPLRPLSSFGEFSSAGVDKKSVEGEVPVRLLNFVDVLRRDFIEDQSLVHWVTASNRQITKCDVRRGDVFFTPSSETRDDIAHSAVAVEDILHAAYSYHVVRFRLTEAWPLDFRAYAFKSKAFLKQAQALCAGSGQRYVLSQKQFASIAIHVPPPDAQHRIGSLLRSIDQERDALIAQAIALREEKAALMQQLLTGKRRVRVAESEAA